MDIPYLGNCHPEGCPEGVIPKGHVLWEMSLGLVYKHNQSIERTICSLSLHNTLSNTLLSTERKADAPFPGVVVGAVVEELDEKNRERPGPLA